MDVITILAGGLFTAAVATYWSMNYNTFANLSRNIDEGRITHDELLRHIDACKEHLTLGMAQRLVTKSANRP